MITYAIVYIKLQPIGRGEYQVNFIPGQQLIIGARIIDWMVVVNGCNIRINRLQVAVLKLDQLDLMCLPALLGIRGLAVVAKGLGHYLSGGGLLPVRCGQFTRQSWPDSLKQI